MKTTINNLGQHGIIKDVVGTGLPVNAWSGGNNVRCNDNWIGSVGGYESLTTVVNGRYLLGYPNSSDFVWIYAADTTGDGTTETLYSYDGTIHTDISSMTYTASDWNSCILNSIVVMNNGADNPQYWNGSGTFSNLIYDGVTDWATQVYSAKVIRAYKNFLFALDVTDSGTNYPHLIHWSNPADPGDIPDSWDYTDTTNESGRNELSETPGFLVDAVTLRDSLVIYKEDAIVLCNYIGGTFQFSFQYLSDSYGLLAQDCAVEVEGRHYCVGKNYVYMHDGHTITPILDTKMQDFLNGQIDPTNYEMTFIKYVPRHSEIWICYPEEGESSCTKALVYHTRTGATTIRNLPGIHFADLGLETSTSDTWDSVTGNWDASTEVWGGRNYSPVTQVFAGITDSDIFTFEAGNQFDGTNATCYAERTGLQIGGTSEVNTVTRLYPRISGGTVQISVGTQMSPYDAVSWSAPVDFTPGDDAKVDIIKTGALHALRISSTANVSWEFNGYEVEYERAGHI